jgi:hypothetical protein
MIVKWKNLIVIAALAVAFVAYSEPAAAQIVYGGGSTFDASSELDVGLLAAERVCNGGSCLTNNGTKLECPASGGPTCQPGEACTCRCIHLQNGTYTAANHCGVIKANAIEYESTR